MELKALKLALLKGAVVGGIRVSLAVPIYILLTPYMLARLGPDLFGIWSFATALLAMLNLTDFGFKGSLVYHAARNSGKPEEIAGYFSAALRSCLMIAAFVILVVALIAPFCVESILKVPAPYQGQAIFVLNIAAVGFGIRFLATPYQALLEAFQEHWYTQMVPLVWLVATSIGSFAALLFKPGVYALGVVSLLGNLLVSYLYFRRVSRLMPAGQGATKKSNTGHLRQLLRYGVPIHLATVAIALKEPVLKALIVRAYGLGEVAAFEIVFRLCTQLVSLMMTPLAGAFAASALLAGRREELREVLRPLLGYKLFILAPVSIFVITFAEPLMHLWLGDGGKRSATLLPYLFAAFAVYYGTEIFYKAIEGAGFAVYSGVIQLGNVSLTVALFLVLAPTRADALQISLLAGAIFFSLSNILVFRRRFHGLTLLNKRQFLSVVLPVGLYLAFSRFTPADLLPVLFALYLLLHVALAQWSGLFYADRIIGRISEFALVPLRRAVSRRNP